jgi:hypothetical protein
MRVKLIDLIDEAESSTLRFATRKEVNACVRKVLHEPASPEDYAVVAEGGTMPLIVLVAKNAENHALSILVKTPRFNFDRESCEIIVDDEPMPILNVVVRETPIDGPPFANVIDATKPVDILRFARELAVEARPTVRNGTPKTFVDAYLLLEEGLDRAPSAHWSADALCAWPIEPEVFIFDDEDPMKLLLRHAVPTFFVATDREYDGGVVGKRRASLLEFIEETEDDGCSAHDKIAACALLRDVARNFAGDPSLSHPAWKPFLPD